MEIPRQPPFHRGRWAIRRERLRLPDGEPTPPFSEARPIRDILRRILTNMRSLCPPWLTEVQQEWNSLVDASVARHARPGRLTGKTLIVFVDSAVWKTELERFAAPRLLHALQARWGADQIEALRFEMDPGEENVSSFDH